MNSINKQADEYFYCLSKPVTMVRMLFEILTTALFAGEFLKPFLNAAIS